MTDHSAIQKRQLRVQIRKDGDGAALLICTTASGQGETADERTGVIGKHQSR